MWQVPLHGFTVEVHEVRPRQESDTCPQQELELGLKASCGS